MQPCSPRSLEDHINHPKKPLLPTAAMLRATSKAQKRESPFKIKSLWVLRRRPLSEAVFWDQDLSYTNCLNVDLAKAEFGKHQAIHDTLDVGFTNQFKILSIRAKKVWGIGSKQDR